MNKALERETNFITLREIGYSVEKAHNMSGLPQETVNNIVDDYFNVKVLARSFNKELFKRLGKGEKYRSIKYDILKRFGFSTKEKIKFKEYSIERICFEIIKREREGEL